MNSRKHPWCELRGQDFATLTGDSESGAENGLCRCRTHCHDQVGPDDPQFRFQPGTARCDLSRIWFFMNPPFATRFPLKMFHRVRDVNLRSIDSSFFKRLIHDFPSRTNKWFARHIFVIARLFANQHHRCVLRSFAKNSLSRSFVQMTGSAVSCGVANHGQTG